MYSCVIVDFTFSKRSDKKVRKLKLFVIQDVCKGGGKPVTLQISLRTYNLCKIICTYI